MGSVRAKARVAVAAQTPPKSAEEESRWTFRRRDGTGREMRYGWGIYAGAGEQESAGTRRTDVGDGVGAAGAVGAVGAGDGTIPGRTAGAGRIVPIAAYILPAAILPVHLMRSVVHHASARPSIRRYDRRPQTDQQQKGHQHGQDPGTVGIHIADKLSQVLRFPQTPTAHPTAASAVPKNRLPCCASFKLGWLPLCARALHLTASLLAEGIKTSLTES